MKEIEFWFSIGSTYTYLTVERIFSVEKEHNVKFIWKPFSVRQIMIEMENVPFTPPPKKNKSDYMWRDIERRAKLYGFEAKVPAPYPLKEFDLAKKKKVFGSPSFIYQNELFWGDDRLEDCIKWINSV